MTLSKETLNKTKELLTAELELLYKKEQEAHSYLKDFKIGNFVVRNVQNYSDSYRTVDFKHITQDYLDFTVDLNKDYMDRLSWSSRSYSCKDVDEFQKDLKDLSK